MYVIEKKIPLPDNIRKATPRNMYPFDKMKVGDSFLVPDKKMSTISVSVATNNRKLKPKRFTARTVKEGVRVWRAS